MKKFLSVLICFTVTLLAAGERDDLLKAFQKEDLSVDEVLQKAETTVDMTAAAGFSSSVARKQLHRALDYKLRHTPDGKERLKIIEDFHQLIRKIEHTAAVPREDHGSLAGMLIYTAIANYLKQHTAILLLDAESETRWKRLANAPLSVNGKYVQLQNGEGTFQTPNEFNKKEKITLTTLIFPKDTFSFGKRDFAIIRTDIPLGVNDDFSTVWLYELKNGKLEVHTRCRFAFFSKWLLQNNTLTIFNETQKDRQIIKL